MAGNPTYRWFETTFNLTEVNDGAFDLSMEFARVLSLEELERRALHDGTNFWMQCYKVLTEQERPYDGRRVIFKGWESFVRRCPRSAKSAIFELLDNFARTYPHALEIIYQ